MSFAANILHSNDLLLGNINPVQTPSKNALPHFDLKNMTLSNKLGNGSQDMVYEVKLNSTNLLILKERKKPKNASRKTIGIEFSI